MDFLTKTNKYGLQCRLPSEAEWEYAARAGTSSSYSWGNKIGTNNANCSNCGSQWDSRETVPVGSFNANPFGLYDMLGNVEEWVQDCWHDNYEGAPVDGSSWETDFAIFDACQHRVLRGGYWNTPADLLTPTSRYAFFPDYNTNYIGFRVVCTPLCNDCND